MADYTLSAKGTYDGSNFNSGVSDSESKLDSFMNKAKSIGSKIESFARGAVTVIGGIGGAIGSLAAQGGMTRALNLEQAQTMFKGLKLEWNDYKDTINDAVDGTAFSLDAAALVAANLAASGVSAGEKMSKALKGAVGVAATFGSELSDIGGLYQKTAALGKLNGEVVQQFAERGINVVATLADQLGKTQDEVKQMVKEGKIDFETFSDAMQAAFGDSAQAANETFTGAMSNMKSALNRIGAKFADPIRKNAIPVFNALRLALNAISERLDPLVEKFSAFADKVSGGLTTKIQAFTDALKNGESIMKALEAAFGTIGSKVAAVIGVFAGIGVAAGALSSVAAAIPGLSTLAGILSGGAASAFSFNGAMGVLKTTFGLFNSPMGAVIALVLALVAAFAHLMATNEEFRNSIMNQVAAIGGTLMPILQNLMTQIMNLANTLIATLLPILESIVMAILPPLLSIIQSLLPLIGQIISVVFQVIEAIMPLIEILGATLIPVIAQVMEFVAQVIAEIVPLVMDAITAITDTVMQYMPQIMELITNVMETIEAIFFNVWPAIQDLVMAVVGFIAQQMATYWPQIQAVIQSAMDVILSVINTVWPYIQTIISTVMNVIKNVISVITAAIRGDWDSVWNGIKNLLQSIWDGMGNIVSEGIQTICRFISELPGKILGFFSNAGSLLINAGKAILDGFLSGLKSAWGGVTSFVGGIADWIASHKGPKSYDLRLLTPNGEWIMQSLTKGFEIGKRGLYQTLNSITDGLVDYNIGASVVAEADGANAFAGDTIGNTYNFGTINIEAKDFDDVETIDDIIDIFMQASRMNP